MGADDLSKGALLEGVIRLAWPCVLQSILSNCYAMNDYLFVGKMADKEMSAACTSAISATVGLQIVAFAFHNIIPAGSNAYTAQYKGAKDTAGLNDVFRSGMFGSLCCSALLAFVGYYNIDYVANMTNSTPEVTEQVRIYFGILVASSPAFGLLLMVDGFYKANGDTRTPLMLEFMSLGINTIGNYLFIFQFNFGIAGAAYASALSRLIPAMLGLRMLLKGRLNIPIKLDIPGFFHPKKIRNNLNTTVKLGNLGIFESASEFLYGAVFTLLIRLSGELGPAQQAGLGCGMRGLEWISFTVSEGFLVAAITAVGHNIGARKQERAMQAAWICCILSSSCAGILGLPFLFFPTQISGILSDDPDIIRFCAQYIYFCGWIMAFVGFEMAAYGVFTGAGQAKLVFYVNGFFNCCRVPIVIFLMYDSSSTWDAFMWVFGFIDNDPDPSLENASDFIQQQYGGHYVVHGTKPMLLKGGFECICWAIVCTSILKALVFGSWMLRRQHQKIYFTDSELVNTSTNDNNEFTGASELPVVIGDSTRYRALSNVEEK